MSEVSNKKSSFSFAAAVGAGMTAAASEKGGAEFLLLINAGRLRMMGAASLCCYLPIEDANTWTARVGKTEVLNKIKIPVFMGCSLADPRVAISSIVDLVCENGFYGTANFPTAALIDGKLRDMLEQQGMGFNRECEFIKEASDRGLKTLAYVTNNEEALKMIAAGATMLCINIGFTHSGSTEPSNISIDNTIKIINRALDGVPAHIVTYVEGGPITTPEAALAICNRSRVQGYIAGSTIDRFPLEETIVEVAKSYRVISQLEEDQSSNQHSNTSFTFGSSKKMREIKTLVEHYSNSMAPILITGASGSGKTALAEEIHRRSESTRSKIIRVNCHSLRHSENGDELFGTVLGYHGRGTPSKFGILEGANNATVLFDEISVLSDDVQTQILNFIDTGLVRRLGSDRATSINCRIIATTQEPISELIKNKQFRTDLYYRLSTLEIAIPPLYERPADIPALAISYIKKESPNKVIKITNSGLNSLMEYQWPGNIRELENVLTRALLITVSHTLKSTSFSFSAIEKHLTETHLSSKEPADVVKNLNLSEPLSEKEWITDALQRNRFRRGKTAEDLGITSRTLYSKIKKYAIFVP